MVEIVRNHEAEAILELIAAKRLTFTAELADSSVASIEMDSDGALGATARVRFNLILTVDGEKLLESIDPDLTPPPNATVDRAGIVKHTKFDDGRQDVRVGGHRFERRTR